MRTEERINFPYNVIPSRSSGLHYRFRCLDLQKKEFFPTYTEEDRAKGRERENYTKSFVDKTLLCPSTELSVPPSKHMTSASLNGSIHSTHCRGQDLPHCTLSFWDDMSEHLGGKRLEKTPLPWMERHVLFRPPRQGVTIVTLDKLVKDGVIGAPGRLLFSSLFFLEKKIVRSILCLFSFSIS